ncbi:MAG: hypothetical protein IKY29_01490, partial [Clostridia bacterium]|nr:hypothetical protein [Clostridia bacterium]
AMEKERAEAERMRRDYEAYQATAERKIQKQLAESETTLEKAREKANAILTSAKVSSDYILEQADKVRRAGDRPSGLSAGGNAP